MMVNMKKLLLTCLVVVNYSAHAEIKWIESYNRASIEDLVRGGVLFAKLNHEQKKGPKITAVKKTGSMLNVAKINTWGFHRYYEFKTQSDANKIQESCYAGGFESVEYYCIEFVN